MPVSGIYEDPSHADLTTAGFIGEVWSLKVLDALESNLVVANLVDRSYEADLTFGDKINVPATQNQTATSVFPGREIEAKDFATTEVEIDIDQWYEAPAAYSERSKIITRPDYLDKAAARQGYAVAKAIDTSLAELFNDLTATWVGSDGQTLTDDIIINVMEGLDEADVPADDRFLVLDPSSKADLLKIDKFVRNDYVKEPVIPTGRFGNIYNMGVFITNNLEDLGTGNAGGMFHRSAIALVMQKKPTVVRIPMPWKHMIATNVDALWGVKVMDSTRGAYFYTRSA